MAKRSGQQGTKETRESLRSLMDGLRGFGRFRKKWRILEGLGRALVVGPALLFLWFIVDCIFRLPAWPLFLLFVLVCLGWLLGIIRWFVWPLFGKIDPEREALQVEKLHGNMDNRLIGALQLGEEVQESERTGHRLGYSKGLARAFVRRISRMWPKLEARQFVDLRSAKRWFGAIWLVVLIAGGCFFLGRDAVTNRVNRLRLAYATVLDTIFPVKLVAHPGNIKLVTGESVDLSVEAKGARRPEIELIMTDQNGKNPRSEMLELKEHKARFKIEKAAESFRYTFRYGRQETEQYTALVADLPRLEAINYELMYPAYTGQPPRTLVGRVPRLRALEGTRVLVSFATTSPLNRDLSHVEWQTGVRQPISIRGRFGHFSFVLEQPDRAKIYLFGMHGKKFRMEKTPSFEIAVRPDESPSVRALLRKKKQTMLAEQATAFALGYAAEDDFGVSEIVLRYKIEGIDEFLNRPTRENEVTRKIDPPRDKIRGRFAKVFEAVEPPLAPGDRIRMTILARDNNTETGPGLGKSQPIEIVVVRPDLAKFTEKEFAFGGRSLLGELHKVKRSTNLLVQPERSVRKEKQHEVEPRELEARLNPESWPSGAEDSVGDYFRLLSEEE
ncbi:MAG: DUF4175 family protein [Candidatus Brocadiia bacterium]